MASTVMIITGILFILIGSELLYYSSYRMRCLKYLMWVENTHPSNEVTFEVFDKYVGNNKNKYANQFQLGKLIGKNTFQEFYNKRLIQGEIL